MNLSGRRDAINPTFASGMSPLARIPQKRCRQPLPGLRNPLDQAKVTVPTEPFIAAVSRECYGYILSHQAGNRINRKERGIGEWLSCMQQQLADIVPRAPISLHFQCRMSTADVLGDGLCSPGFIILPVGKLHVEGPKTSTRCLLGCRAYQR